MQIVEKVEMIWKPYLKREPLPSVEIVEMLSYLKRQHLYPVGIV